MKALFDYPLDELKTQSRRIIRTHTTVVDA